MKKVLIITYYWPPSGGIGVNRCLKFVKYLRGFNWEPVIYTAENADYPYLDLENINQVPKDIVVLKKRIIEPFKLYKYLVGKKKDDVLDNPLHVRTEKRKLFQEMFIWVRGNFFIPDARALWINPSVNYLSNYLKNNKIDAILSDGPPHTNSVIAYKLSKKFNIPLLADFQDPWTQVDYYKLFKLTKWADRKHRKMEQKVFDTAKKITIVSPSWKTDLENLGAKNVDVVFWGYDEDDFKGLNQKLDKKFTLYHAGLLGFDRSPKILFKVLSDLKNEIPGFSNDLQINLAGSIDFSVIELIKSYNLMDSFNSLGTISRKKSLQNTLNAQILLLLINKAENAKGRIPGKLFELLRSNRPVLALGMRGSDSQNIIETTQSGVYFEYEDYDNIKSFIIEKYELYRLGKNFLVAQKDISEFDVKNQTKKVADYLDEIITV